MFEAVRHSAYPFTHLCTDNKLNPPVYFNFMESNVLEEKVHIGNSYLKVEQVQRVTSNDDLSVHIYSSGGMYEVRAESSEAMNNEQTIQIVANAVCNTVQNIINCDIEDVLVRDIPVVSDEEEQALIALGTGKTLDYDHSNTFIDLFREQVGRTPNAVAVVDEDSQLTYQELDEASTEYARKVAPDTFVCLEMPRRKEFVVAVLGIWKAGSAYVPIDTEYPEERKQFIREECDGQPLPQPDIAYMIYTPALQASQRES